MPRSIIRSIIYIVKERRYNLDSRKMAKVLKQHGWKHVRTTGDHMIFKHDNIDQIISLPHSRKDIAKGTLKNILKIAGLK